MNKTPYWVNAREWMCPRHLPGTRLPAGTEHCWYYLCPSSRPKRTREVPPNVVPQITLCAWEECRKGLNGRAEAREKSKYCSRDCSNRFARHQHKLRKNLKSEAA